MNTKSLIESLRIEHCLPQLTDFHYRRMLLSLKELYPQSQLLVELQQTTLSDFLERYYPSLLKDCKRELIYKLRFLYNQDSIYDISITPYSPKKIDKLYLYPIEGELDYHYKYADRKALAVFDDERIPLFVKDNMLTDTSYTNIVLRFGEELLTPQNPLLKGVMRAYLLESGQIKEAQLSVAELQRADELLMINALLPLERAISVNPKHIY